MLHHLRIELRDVEHPVIQHDDVRIVVDAPDVRLAVASRVRARAVRLEVGDAVDGVGIRLLVGHLHPAPEILADVELEAFDLLLIRKEDVLRGDVRRPRIPGIVVGVGEPRGESVAILGAAADLVLLVPVAVHPDVPLRRIGVLVVRDEKRCALLDDGLERLGDEELERRPLAVAVLDTEHVLAKPAEGGAIDGRARRAGGGHALDACRVGMLGRDRRDLLLRTQREHRRQIGRHHHAGNDGHVDLALPDQHVADGGGILCPAEPERIGERFPGRDRCPRYRQPPVAPVRFRRRPRHLRVDVRGERAARAVVVLELRTVGGRHHEKRTDAVAPLPDHEGRVAADVRVAQQLLRVDIAARAGPLGERERHREIAELHRTCAGVAQRDRPVEAVSVERERPGDGEIVGRRNARIAADAPLGHAHGRVLRHRRLDAHGHRPDRRELHRRESVRRHTVGAARGDRLPLAAVLIQQPPALGRLHPEDFHLPDLLIVGKRVLDPLRRAAAARPGEERPGERCRGPSGTASTAAARTRRRRDHPVVQAPQSAGAGLRDSAGARSERRQVDAERVRHRSSLLLTRQQQLAQFAPVAVRRGAVADQQPPEAGVLREVFGVVDVPGPPQAANARIVVLHMERAVREVLRLRGPGKQRQNDEDRRTPHSRTSAGVPSNTMSRCV